MSGNLFCGGIMSFFWRLCFHTFHCSADLHTGILINIRVFVLSLRDVPTVIHFHFSLKGTNAFWGCSERTSKTHKRGLWWKGYLLRQRKHDFLHAIFFCYVNNCVHTGHLNRVGWQIGQFQPHIAPDPVFLLYLWCVMHTIIGNHLELSWKTHV